MVVTDEEQGGSLVGFGCAMPFDKAPADVREFIEGLDEKGRIPTEFEYRRAWYMSELGVLNDYRGLGAAWELVKQRMRTVDWKGDTWTNLSENQSLRRGLFYCKRRPILDHHMKSATTLHRKAQNLLLS